MIRKKIISKIIDYFLFYYSNLTIIIVMYLILFLKSLSFNLLWSTKLFNI